MLDYLVIVVLAALGAFLLWMLLKGRKRSPPPANGPFDPYNTSDFPDTGGFVRQTEPPSARSPAPRSCPVCSMKLAEGMRVKSTVSKGSNGSLMYVYGCPYCWPDNPVHSRTCPVCGKTVPVGGYLVARYFEKPGHKHVHVLGCTGCRKA